MPYPIHLLPMGYPGITQAALGVPRDIYAMLKLPVLPIYYHSLLHEGVGLLNMGLGLGPFLI